MGKKITDYYHLRAIIEQPKGTKTKPTNQTLNPRSRKESTIIRQFRRIPKTTQNAKPTEKTHMRSITNASKKKQTQKITNKTKKNVKANAKFNNEESKIAHDGVKEDRYSRHNKKQLEIIFNTRTRILQRM